MGWLNEMCIRDSSANGVTGVRAYAYAYAVSLYRFAKSERDTCAYLIVDGREAVSYTHLYMGIDFDC